VSKEEQRLRFLARLDDENKQWKFNFADIAERKSWDSYMSAYEDALNVTSKEWAPWYAIPADDKPFMRAEIAEIIVNSLGSIGLQYPRPSEEARAKFAEARQELSREPPE